MRIDPVEEQHCEDHGITHEFSSPYKHGQNGVVERRMGTVGSSARAQMHYGNAPAREWKYAVKHTVAATNDWPTKANGGQTPRSRLYNVYTPPNRYLLKAPIFCLVILITYEAQRTKYGDRGREALYLGIDDRPGIFLARELPNGRVVYASEGQFHADILKRQIESVRPMRLEMDERGRTVEIMA